MTTTNREYVAAHRLRKKIENAIVPGSILVSPSVDPITGEKHLVFEASFTVEGWKSVEKLGKLTNRTGQEVYVDSLKVIMSRIKMPPIRKAKKTPPNV